MMPIHGHMRFKSASRWRNRLRCQFIATCAESRSPPWIRTARLQSRRPRDASEILDVVLDYTASYACIRQGCQSCRDDRLDIGKGMDCDSDRWIVCLPQLQFGEDMDGLWGLAWLVWDRKVLEDTGSAGRRLMTSSQGITRDFGLNNNHDERELGPINFGTPFIMRKSVLWSFHRKFQCTFAKLFGCCSGIHCWGMICIDWMTVLNECIEHTCSWEGWCAMTLQKQITISRYPS